MKCESVTYQFIRNSRPTMLTRGKFSISSKFLTVQEKIKNYLFMIEIFVSLQ